MAKENVKKFYEAVAADEGLRVRLSELNKQYQGEAMDEEKKAALVKKLVLPIAAEIGLVFTIEELRQYEEEMVQASANRELDNNELEAVAGGLSLLLGGELCFVVGAGVGAIAGTVLCFIGGAAV
ncbi:MAG: hypothetical protein APF81_20155 [Desulfosporosinus sp. BRH_c37]|nr:MAG: hypothetical protein APF81_20155 [Desulfosporosinus sp. BRH_c37]